MALLSERIGRRVDGVTMGGSVDTDVETPTGEVTTGVADITEIQPVLKTPPTRNTTQPAPDPDEPTGNDPPPTDEPRTGERGETSQGGASTTGEASTTGSGGTGPVPTDTGAATREEMEHGGCRNKCNKNTPTQKQGRTSQTRANANVQQPPATQQAGVSNRTLLLLGIGLPILYSMLTEA